MQAFKEFHSSPLPHPAVCKAPFNLFQHIIQNFNIKGLFRRKPFRVKYFQYHLRTYDEFISSLLK